MVNANGAMANLPLGDMGLGRNGATADVEDPRSDFATARPRGPFGVVGGCRLLREPRPPGSTWWTSIVQLPRPGAGRRAIAVPPAAMIRTTRRPGG